MAYKLIARTVNIKSNNSRYRKFTFSHQGVSSEGMTVHHLKSPCDKPNDNNLMKHGVHYLLVEVNVPATRDLGIVIYTAIIFMTLTDGYAKVSYDGVDLADSKGPLLDLSMARCTIADQIANSSPEELKAMHANISAGFLIESQLKELDTDFKDSKEALEVLFAKWEAAPGAHPLAIAHDAIEKTIKTLLTPRTVDWSQVIEVNTEDNLTINTPHEHSVEQGRNSARDLFMLKNYPHYWKDCSMYGAVDVYRVHEIFNIQDPSGRIQHASKKLLVSGGRGGQKDKYLDVKEAHLTLGGWLEDNRPEGDDFKVNPDPSVDGIKLTVEELQAIRRMRESSSL